MLTPRAIEYLTPLTYNESAKRLVCYIPIGGIYWEDEIPEIQTLQRLPEPDRKSIYHLFRIRIMIWNGKALTPEDRHYWEAAKGQVPHYALFHRLELSEDDRRVQDQVALQSDEIFEALCAEADEVTVEEKEGFQSFSITIDLTKPDRFP